MYRFNIVLLFILLLLNYETVFSAGFDCSKASTKIEKLICQDSLLNKLDEELSNVFNQLKKDLPTNQFNAIKKTQIQWIKSRNKSLCKDTQSCSIAYNQQIRKLQNKMKESCLKEANGNFKYKNKLIHPGLVKEFETDISDYAPSITVSVDVEAAYGSNEYYEDISIDKEGKCTINPDDNPRTSYSYKRIGMIKPNIHALITWNWEGGSSAECSLLCVNFSIRNGYQADGVTPSQRLAMNVIRKMSISNIDDVKIKNDKILIGQTPLIFD